MDVASYATISKEDGRWKAVVLYNQYGKNRVAVYLWRKNDESEWKRKQKYMIRSSEDWSQDQQAIEEAVMKM